MADFPICPNCQREQRLVGESQTHWAFRCRWCHTVRIFSKPSLRGASRLEVELARRQSRIEKERLWDARPRYSLPPPSPVKDREAELSSAREANG